MSEIETDVCIVGAGVAGLYTAHRLLQRDANLRITILEALTRTGGRLETDHVNVNGTIVKTEEGGMRFMPSHHRLVALLTELNLMSEAVDFPMGDEHNLFFLRGRRFTSGEAKQRPAIWSELYALNPEVQGKQPGAILNDILRTLLSHNGLDPVSWTATPEEWTQLRIDCSWKGIPLYRWGFWALLTDFGLSADAVAMLYQSSGFIAPYDQDINAGSALQLLVDFVHPAFFTLQPGYEALPNALVAAITPQVDIRLDHAVVGMERQSDGRWRVAAHRSDGTTVEVLAPRVVLAVTESAMEALIPFVADFRNSPTFRADVAGVADMHLGKINLYFAHNWWTPATGVWSGGSWTDLPLAQFYCFGASATAPTNAPASVTLYTDATRTGYWHQLQHLGAAYTHPMSPLLPQTAIPASAFVVEQAMRQLSSMLGVASPPAPLAATWRQWGGAAGGDGDHSWRVGVRDDLVRTRLANPFPGVYTCGETWSDDQAWVNGALRSADAMLAVFT